MAGSMNGNRQTASIGVEENGGIDERQCQPKQQCYDRYREKQGKEKALKTKARDARSELLNLYVDKGCVQATSEEGYRARAPKQESDRRLTTTAFARETTESC